MAKNTSVYYNTVIITSLLVGMLLASYAYYVEIQSELNEEYSPMCDVNEYVKCSKVFKSEYAKGLGIVGKYLGDDSILNISNAVLLGLMYLILIIMAFSNNVKIIKWQLIISIMSNVCSVYFIYLLYFVLQDFCIVCMNMHVINVVNTRFIYMKLKNIKSKGVKRD